MFTQQTLAFAVYTSGQDRTGQDSFDSLLFIWHYGALTLALVFTWSLYFAQFLFSILMGFKTELSWQCAKANEVRGPVPPQQG